MMNERVAWALMEEAEERAAAHDEAVEQAVSEHDCPHKTVDVLVVKGPPGGIRVVWCCGGCGDEITYQQPQDDREPDHDD